MLLILKKNSKSGNIFLKILLILLMCSICTFLIIFPILNYFNINNNTNKIFNKASLVDIIKNCRNSILERQLPEGYFYEGDQVHCTSHILRALNLVRMIYNYSIDPRIDLMKNSIENNRQTNLFWRCNEFIPTDIDTTLQALSALKGLSNDSFLYASLDNLSELQLTDGSFKTWIDVGNYTFEELHTEPDCIENDEIGVVLYYTYKFNKTRYNDMLYKGAEYISFQQHENGTWTTPWYLGDYYGIYKIASFLSMYNKSKYTSELQKSYSFVINTRNPDNGWGRNGISNPLDTAYCITFLLHYTNNIYIIQDSMKYLIQAQGENHLWEEVPFYQIVDEPENLIFGPDLMISAIILETLGIYLQNLNI